MTSYRYGWWFVLVVSVMTVLPPVLGDPSVTGQDIYDRACFSCHGADGEGMMPGVPDLTVQNSVLQKPEAELVRNTMQGVQSPGSPLAMPPKGGNPDLTEQNIVDAIRYMQATFLSR